MAGKIELEEFDEVGITRGPEGVLYLILMERDLHPIRKDQILIQLIKGKLDLEGHYYDPKNRTDLLSLKSDSD